MLLDHRLRDVVLHREDVLELTPREIVTELARRMLELGAAAPSPEAVWAGWRYPSASAVMAEIGALTPSYAGVTYDRLNAGEQLHWPVRDAGHPGTPVLHAGKFVRGLGRFVASEHLPPAEQWPEFLFELPELQFAPRLNCAAELLDLFELDGAQRKLIGEYSKGKIRICHWIATDGDFEWKRHWSARWGIARRRVRLSADLFYCRWPLHHCGALCRPIRQRDGRCVRRPETKAHAHE